MAIKKNGKGVSHANALILAGKVDRTSAWSFSADDGNRLLGDDDWKEYGKWFLATDSDADPMTKEHFRYPFGKGGKVYRRAVIAIKSRAAQQDETEIADAADTLLGKVDKESEEAAAQVASGFDELPDAPVELPEVPPAEFRVFPRGEYRTRQVDIKTGQVVSKAYLVDDDAMAAIIADRERYGNDTIIDWEHKAIEPRTPEDGSAAGWVPKFEARSDGLYATGVRWTPKAVEKLAAREYRYHSPFFIADKKSGRITSLEMISLVSWPASVGQVPIAASAAAMDGGKEQDMAKVLEVLGAKTDDEAVAAVEKMTAAAGEHAQGIAAAKKAADDAQAEIVTAQAATAAIQKERDRSDALLFETMAAAGCARREDLVGAVTAHKDLAAGAAAMKAELAKLAAEREHAEREALIATAKIGEDKARWLREQKIETVRSYVAACCAAPEIATTPQSAGAAARPEERPEQWFLELDHIERLPREEQSKQWRAHLVHKESTVAAATNGKTE